MQVCRLRRKISVITRLSPNSFFTNGYNGPAGGAAAGPVGQKEVSCAGLCGPARAARALLYGSLRMAADSWGVMGMFWGLSACVHVSRSRRSSMSGGAAGGVSHGSVHVVGNVQTRVPGGGADKANRAVCTHHWGMCGEQSNEHSRICPGDPSGSWTCPRNGNLGQAQAVHV